MIARSTALLLALAIGVTALPTGDGYRCLLMHQRMTTAACCASCEPPAQASIGRPCCEVVRGARLEARAQSTVEQPRLSPASLVAILPLPPAPALELDRTCRDLGSRCRGRPPGEQLQQLSQVLRV
jgi:hypothetical protein